MPGSPAHLFRRFIDVATARPLTGRERDDVAGRLGHDAARLFFDQDPVDQRHAYHAARVVVAAGVEDDDVIAAALLHDVGKRHARLGLIGRTVASILILLGVRLTERMTIYRDHGLVGARELAELGLASVVVDFAMHHHGPRPPTIEPATWDLLVAADQPPKASSALASRIISVTR